MKGNYIHKALSILLLAIISYNVFLIGGGRGPFALNRSYWICHCDDPARGEEVSRESLYDSFEEPERKGGDLLASLEVRESGNDSEMCLSSLASGTSSPFKICKRKLPLVYLSILLGNGVLYQGMVPSAQIRPYYPHIKIRHDSLFSLREGFSLLLPRPPRLS